MTTPNKCCMNCSYYYATPDKAICTLDNELIDVEISHIAKCKAFDMWWGSV